MKFSALRVGELARRTGLTIRTLHHYDEIGLLKPSLRSGGGYRLYTADDVARLQHVLSLRQLGFSLEEIRDCLGRAEFAPMEAVRLHLARVQEQMAKERELCRRLEAIASHFQSAEEVSAEEFLQTIEAITMSDRYFTPEQLELINRRRAEAGEALLAERQEDWAELIAEIRAAMDAGVDPNEVGAQALAERWMEMVDETTAGDPAIKQSLKRLWDEQGDALAAQYGSQYDPRPVIGYITSAIGGMKDV